MNDLGKQLSGYFVEYLDNQKLTGKVEEYFANEKTGGVTVSLYGKPEVQVVSQEREAPRSGQKVAPVAPVEPASVQPVAVVPAAEEKQVAVEPTLVAEPAPKQEETSTVQVDAPSVPTPTTEGQPEPKQ